MIGHLGPRLQAAQDNGYFVIHSPHWYNPTDVQWVAHPGAIAEYLFQIGFVARSSSVYLDGFEGSRADFFEPFRKTR